MNKVETKAVCNVQTLRLKVTVKSQIQNLRLNVIWNVMFISDFQKWRSKVKIKTYVQNGYPKVMSKSDVGLQAGGLVD